MSKSSFLASASLFCALTLMRAQSTIGTPIDLSSIPGNLEATKSKLSCSLSGVARNPDGKPLAEVQIAAHSVTGTTDRIVTSAGDGGFCIEYLLSGYYELTAKVQGFVSSRHRAPDFAFSPKR